MNLMAPALGVYLTKLIFDGRGQTDILQHPLATVTIPLLSKIPIIGPIFFTKTSLVAYIGIFVSIAAWWVLAKTRFGLRLRSVGEHPEAADSVGISVYAYRYAGVLISGFLGGIGGAVMAQSITLIFFGFAQSLAIVGKYIPVIKTMPDVIFTIAPYLITIIVLVAFIGNARMPEADGSTFIKAK
jgi:simple sugar transport system permease protein